MKEPLSPAKGCQTSTPLMVESPTLNFHLFSPLTPSSSEPSQSKLHQNPNSNPKSPFSSLSPSPSPYPSPSPSSIRLWRPQAQRNLRNQWSKLLSLKKDWSSTLSSSKSHVQGLANAYLNKSYLPAMVSSVDLGVISDIPNIRDKLSRKLACEHARDQDLFQSKLLSSYKQMVGIVSQMSSVSNSMRSFVKSSTGSSLLQYSNHSVDKNDFGDGGGTAVFTFWSISDFEMVAQELVEMFGLELILKRFLVVELLSLGREQQNNDTLSWLDELYPGEFEDLISSNLYSEESAQPILPRINGHEPSSLPARSSSQPTREVLQVYSITWLAELNVKPHRVDEIFTIVGEEMHATL